MNRYWSLRHGILRNSIYQCSLKSGRNFLEPFLATKLEYLWRQPPIIGPVIPVRENGDTCEINHKEKRAKGSVGNERALVYSYIQSSNTFFPPLHFFHIVATLQIDLTFQEDWLDLRCAYRVNVYQRFRSMPLINKHSPSVKINENIAFRSNRRIQLKLFTFLKSKMVVSRKSIRKPSPFPIKKLNYYKYSHLNLSFIIHRDKNIDVNRKRKLPSISPRLI